MEAFLAIVIEQAKQQSLTEAAAVLFSLMYPYLAARQNIWCWFCALVSTSLYVHVFWQGSLPFNSFLNVYYLLMAIYGWVRWRKNSQGEELPVRVYPLFYHITAIAVLVVAGLTLNHLVTFSWIKTDLYLDALVTVFSVYATYLMANKILENWLFWIVINFAAAYLYFINGLMLTGLMFIGYFFMSVYGYRNWQRDYQQQGNSTPNSLMD
ncbi:nicotinamide riboside transporter PnuC [Aliiglaciecola litoralis]|uniref:Nicotinamide riboside transporter PnuC n=1 Tax=Aliiglaciecola litoralis TaxID=582857 RepID=A0ABP3WWS0_9ALTE